MAIVKIQQAHAHASRLTEENSSGVRADMIPACNGKPAAQQLSIESCEVKLGVLSGRYQIPADIDTDNAEIADEFEAL